MIYCHIAVELVAEVEVRVAEWGEVRVGVEMPE
jgi:hypothetical protein